MESTIFQSHISFFVLTAQTLLLVPVLLALYVVGLVIYRLTLHPYAKYPGPIVAKVKQLLKVLQQRLLTVLSRLRTSMECTMHTKETFTSMYGNAMRNMVHNFLLAYLIVVLSRF